MKVYRPHEDRIPVHCLFVQPGTEYRNANFVHPDGTVKSFRVEFRHGVAMVSDELGRYLIDKGLAAKSPIILPETHHA